MNKRLKSFIAQFTDHQIDAYLVTKEINITYLTEFLSQESWLLVTPKKSFYITDFRYLLEAQKGLKGIAIKCYSNSLYQALWEVLSHLGIRQIGFDERHISVAQFKKFKTESPRHLRWIAAGGLVESLREVKDKEETSCIRQALSIHQKALLALKKIIVPGITEGDVLLRLERFVKSHGVKFSFDPIIASGSNSCYPHAKITNRRINSNEIVLVDFGIDFLGYKSDLTRIFFLGKIPHFRQEIFDHVQQAQRKAIDLIKADVVIADVDKAARNYLEEKKLGKYFGHALGHGVGLEIHESPRLSAENPMKLIEGMIITVEPAVYIPHQFGIRLEEMVLVLKNKAEVLSANID